MPAKALQPAHCAEGGFQPLDGFDHAGPAEIMGRQDREQIKPDIGGRGAMGDDRLRFFLEIIRRQHVVFRPDELLEEFPGPPRDEPQRPFLVLVEIEMACYCRWQAGPARNRRRDHP